MAVGSLNGFSNSLSVPDSRQGFIGLVVQES
jgi:hypothetical protein